MRSGIGRYLELAVLTLVGFAVPVLASAFLLANAGYFRFLREYQHPGREAIALVLFLISALMAPRTMGSVGNGILVVLAIAICGWWVAPIHAAGNPSTTAFISRAGPALFLVIYAILVVLDTKVRLERIREGSFTRR